MIAIIPCAGRGTRRRPDTEHTPKILLEHEGQPLIEHIVRPIDASGRFEKIVLVLSLKHGQQVIDYTHRHPFETPVSFVWQNEPLGFGHAVLQAREEVFSFRKWNPPVLVCTDDGIREKAGKRENGKTGKRENEKNLIASITASDVSQVGVQWRGNVRNYGMVVTGEARRRGSEGAGKILRPGHLPRPNSPSEKSGKKNSHTRHLAPTQTQPLVERLVEKPYWEEGGLCMTGIYYIRESRRLFRCLNKLVKMGRCLGGEYQFTHALQMMIDAGTPFATYYHDWVDCGNLKINARTQCPDSSGSRPVGRSKGASESYIDYLRKIGEIE